MKSRITTLPMRNSDGKEDGKGNTKMKSKAATLALLLFLGVGFASAHQSDIEGRWEIVHLTGDNLLQYNPNANPPTGFPGGFSTYLMPGGVGGPFRTFDDTACDQIANWNITPTWTQLPGGQYQITITVTGNATGTFQFIYTGTYTSEYKQTADDGRSVFVTAIYGNYTTTGDVGACSYGGGQFVATHFPDLSKTTYAGQLHAGDSAPLADQSAISAELHITSTSPGGGLGGTFRFGTITYNGQACFVPAGSGITTILNSTSSEAGAFIVFYTADKAGTQFILTSISADLANDPSNGTGVPLDAYQGFIAAVGEDDPSAGFDGIANDGTNRAIAGSYFISGGPCDGLEGSAQFAPKVVYHRSGRPCPEDRRQKSGPR